MYEQNPSLAPASDPSDVVSSPYLPSLGLPLPVLWEFTIFIPNNCCYDDRTEDLEPGQVAPLPLPCVQIRECSRRNTAPALTLLYSSCQSQHYCQCFLCSFQEPHHGCHLECAMCLPSKQLGDGNREIRTLKSVSTTIGSLRSVHLHDTYLKTKVKKQKQINQN